MIDRLVHHADVVARKGDSYRPCNRDLGRIPPADPTDTDLTNFQLPLTVGALGTLANSTN